MRNTSSFERIDPIVSRNIRTLRVARKMSQTTLANKLDITFQQIQKYEKGVNSLPSGRIRELCHVLGVTPNDLFEFKEVGAGKIKVNGQPPVPQLSAWATKIAFRMEGLDGRVKQAINGLVQGLVPEPGEA